MSYSSNVLFLLLLACAHVTAPLGCCEPAAPSTSATTGAPTSGTSVAAVAVPGVALAPADPIVERLLAAARADTAAWDLLADLCDGIGARPTGSPALAKAVDWGVAQFGARDGLKVAKEPVMVPVWTRGAESLLMLTPHAEPLAMLGLGGSVGTTGVEAPVVVVSSFAELGPQVAGKIVLFNHPMEEGTPTIERYGTAVAYRSQGAAKAATFGAVAALVRSVTTRSLDTPHTGGMRYVDGTPRIPTASITTEDAARIARMTQKGQEVRLRLQMGAATRPDELSHNVVAELPGETDEIVLIGAHLDSWDVGQGAHDDGAGVVHVIEAMRHLQALGVTPRRTIRAVLFTNEEFGIRGAYAYDAAHGTDKHVAAIESDLGGGRPLGWTATGAPADLAWLDQSLAATGLGVVGVGGGADIGPLEERGVLVMGLAADDERYFDIHHTRADTVDKVDPAALAEGVGQLAALTWRLANAPRGAAIATQ
ncbi:MAG: M20/M25/M40 family metallo-hydrolase [Pseudomonadota bacterium]|nr:M20/M25/M40 family metallo-hydrolase [Pseudomonadota bacterium]